MFPYYFVGAPLLGFAIISGIILDCHPPPRLFHLLIALTIVALQAGTFLCSLHIFEVYDRVQHVTPFILAVLCCSAWISSMSAIIVWICMAFQRAHVCLAASLILVAVEVLSFLCRDIRTVLFAAGLCINTPVLLLLIFGQDTFIGGVPLIVIYALQYIVILRPHRLPCRRPIGPSIPLPTTPPPPRPEPTEMLPWPQAGAQSSSGPPRGVETQPPALPAPVAGDEGEGDQFWQTPEALPPLLVLLLVAGQIPICLLRWSVNSELSAWDVGTLLSLLTMITLYIAIYMGRVPVGVPSLFTFVLPFFREPLSYVAWPVFLVFFLLYSFYCAQAFTWRFAAPVVPLASGVPPVPRPQPRPPSPAPPPSGLDTAARFFSRRQGGGPRKKRRGLARFALIFIKRAESTGWATLSRTQNASVSFFPTRTFTPCAAPAFSLARTFLMFMALCLSFVVGDWINYAERIATSIDPAGPPLPGIPPLYRIPFLVLVPMLCWYRQWLLRRGAQILYAHFDRALGHQAAPPQPSQPTTLLSLLGGQPTSLPVPERGLWPYMGAMLVVGLATATPTTLIDDEMFRLSSTIDSPSNATALMAALVYLLILLGCNLVDLILHETRPADLSPVGPWRSLTPFPSFLDPDSREYTKQAASPILPMSASLSITEPPDLLPGLPPTRSPTPTPTPAPTLTASSAPTPASTTPSTPVSPRPAIPRPTVGVLSQPAIRPLGHPDPRADEGSLSLSLTEAPGSNEGRGPEPDLPFVTENTDFRRLMAQRPTQARALLHAPRLHHHLQPRTPNQQAARLFMWRAMTSELAALGLVILSVAGRLDVSGMAQWGLERAIGSLSPSALIVAFAIVLLAWPRSPFRLPPSVPAPSSIPGFLIPPLAHAYFDLGHLLRAGLLAARLPLRSAAHALRRCCCGPRTDRTAMLSVRALASSDDGEPARLPTDMHNPLEHAWPWGQPAWPCARAYTLAPPVILGIDAARHADWVVVEGLHVVTLGQAFSVLLLPLLPGLAALVVYFFTDQPAVKKRPGTVVSALASVLLLFAFFVGLPFALATEWSVGSTLFAENWAGAPLTGRLLAGAAENLTRANLTDISYRWAFDGEHLVLLRLSVVLLALFACLVVVLALFVLPLQDTLMADHRFRLRRFIDHHLAARQAPLATLLGMHGARSRSRQAPTSASQRPQSPGGAGPAEETVAQRLNRLASAGMGLSATTQAGAGADHGAGGAAPTRLPLDSLRKWRIVLEPTQDGIIPLSSLVSIFADDFAVFSPRPYVEHPSPVPGFSPPLADDFPTLATPHSVNASAAATPRAPNSAGSALNTSTASSLRLPPLNVPLPHSLPTSLSTTPLPRLATSPRPRVPLTVQVPNQSVDSLDTSSQSSAPVSPLAAPHSPLASPRPRPSPLSLPPLLPPLSPPPSPAARLAAHPSLFPPPHPLPTSGGDHPGSSGALDTWEVREIHSTPSPSLPVSTTAATTPALQSPSPSLPSSPPRVRPLPLPVLPAQAASSIRPHCVLAWALMAVVWLSTDPTAAAQMGPGSACIVIASVMATLQAALIGGWWQWGGGGWGADDRGGDGSARRQRAWTSFTLLSIPIGTSLRHLIVSVYSALRYPLSATSVFDYFVLPGIVWGLWSSILYLPSVRQRLAIRFHASRRLALVPLASMPFDVQRKWWEGIVAKEAARMAPSVGGGLPLAASGSTLPPPVEAPSSSPATAVSPSPSVRYPRPDYGTRPEAARPDLRPASGSGGPSRDEQVQPEDESIFAGASYISLPPARMLYWWRLAGLFIGAAASSSWYGGYPTVVWLAVLALAAFLVRKLTIVVLAPYLVFPVAIWLFQTDVRLACSLPFGLSCALFPCALWVRTWGAKPRAHRLVVGHYVGLVAFSLPLAWRTIGILPAVTFLWLIIVPLISDSRLPREVVLFAALCYGLVMCIINSYVWSLSLSLSIGLVLALWGTSTLTAVLLATRRAPDPLVHRPALVRRERKIVRPLRILAGILAVLCFAAGSCGLLAVPTHGVAPIVAFATALSLGCLAAIRGWSHALLLAALPCAIAAGVGLGWVGPATTAGVAPWSLFGLPALGVALWAWAVSAMVLTHPAVVRRILARSATFSFRTLFRAIPDAFSRAPPPSAPQPPQPDKSLAPQGAPPAPSRPLYAVLTPGHLAMALLCRSAAFLVAAGWPLLWIDMTWGIATIVGTGFWVGALLTWEVVLPAAAAVPFLALMGSWGLFSAVAPSSDAWGWASLVLLILCSLCAPCFAFGVFPRIRMFPTSGIHNEQAADLFVLWALVGIRAYTVTRGFAPLIVALLVVGASWHTRVPWFLLSGPALLAVSALPLHWAFGDPAWAGFPWSVRWVTGLLMACLAVVLWAALRPRPVRRLTCPHWVFIPVTSLVQATPVARPATNVPGLFVIPIPQSGPPAAQPLAPLPPPEKDAALFRDHSTSSLETGSASSLSMALPGAAHLSPPLADSSPWPVPAGPSEPSNISTDGLVLPFAEPEHPAMPPILLPSAGPQPLSPSFHSLATATRRFATFPSRDSCFSPDPAPLAPAVLNRLSARFPPTALPWGSLASSRTPRSPSAPSLADSSLSRRKSISSLPLSESFHEPISEEMASGDGATAMAVPPARPPRAGDEGSEMSDLDGPAPPLAPATAPTRSTAPPRRPRGGYRLQELQLPGGAQPPPSPLSETSSDSSLTLDAGEEPGTPTAGLGPARLQHPVPRRSALYMAPTTKEAQPAAEAGPPARGRVFILFSTSQSPSAPVATRLQAETPGGGNRAGYLGPSFEGLPQKLRDVFAYYQWLSIRHHQPPATTSHHHQPPPPATTRPPPATTTSHPPPPATTSHQPPATTTSHQPPPATTSHHQPPPATTSHHQPPPATTSHHQPPATSHQPPPPATTHHPPATATTRHPTHHQSLLASPPSLSVLGRPLLEETFLHLVDVACFVQLSCGVGLIASHPDALWLTPAVVSLVGLLFGVWGLLQPRVWWYVVMGAATIVGACSAFFAVGLPASVIGPTVGYVLAAVMLGVAQFRFRWRQRQRPPAPVASPPPPPASPQPIVFPSPFYAYLEIRVVSHGGQSGCQLLVVGGLAGRRFRVILVPGHG
ncbi:hypothetical protein PAPYR_8344 [Paratrimastix pyriformis]|uniref:Uncharacterized protein n=1 Tax=Paratrimastix pyriformis TaxID=342808 RepID=A0ABQ8UAW8_9EUKA|nr:hypothetical protein PAPYR_8344 [Paratrimastix pyriformis]